MSSVLLFMAGRNKVVLMWVSGHLGISGMEAVYWLVRAGFPCFRTGPKSLCRLSFSNYPNGWSLKEGRDDLSRFWFSAPCLQEDEWLITSLE